MLKLWRMDDSRKWRPTFFFNPNQLEKTRFSGKILVKSIKTGIRLRDQHLKKPLYFNEPLFPAIEIQLLSIQSIGQQKLQGTFSIRIKGIEKQQNIPFTYSIVNGNYVFAGNFLVNRRDFKVGGQSWTLAEYANVSVRFEVSPL